MVISPEYSGFALGLAEVRVLVEQVNRCGGNAGAGQSCKMHQSAFDVYGPINEQRSARQWAFSMSTVLDLLAVCGRAQLLDHEQPPPEPTRAGGQAAPPCCRRRRHQPTRDREPDCVDINPGAPREAARPAAMIATRSGRFMRRNRPERILDVPAAYKVAAREVLRRALPADAQRSLRFIGEGGSGSKVECARANPARAAAPDRDDLWGGLVNRGLLGVADGLGEGLLNRSEAGNAFAVETLEARSGARQRCIEDEALGAALLCGNGRPLCAGGYSEGHAARARRLASIPQGRAWLGVHRNPRLMQPQDKPVVAAVQGAARGAGIDMALQFDLRLRRRDPHIGWGAREPSRVQVQEEEEQ